MKGFSVRLWRTILFLQSSEEGKITGKVVSRVVRVKSHGSRTRYSRDVQNKVWQTQKSSSFEAALLVSFLNILLSCFYNMFRFQLSDIPDVCYHRLVCNIQFSKFKECDTARPFILLLISFYFQLSYVDLPACQVKGVSWYCMCTVHSLLS
jgi:hypothetical protein